MKSILKRSCLLQIELSKELKSLGLIRAAARKTDNDIAAPKHQDDVINDGPILFNLNSEIVAEEEIAAAENEVSRLLPSPDDDSVICMDKVMTITEIEYDEQVKN